MPLVAPLPSDSQLVLLGDFLGPPDEFDASVSGFALPGVRGHLLKIIDPAEETLPFAGPRYSRALSSILSNEASGGAIFWVGDGNVPEVRRVAPGRLTAGHGWLGLRENGDYVVTGVSEVPLLPGFLTLLLAVGLFIAAWRQEGR